jgi:hypothetical protein
MKITNYTIGADPEMFLIDTRTGHVVSAEHIIPGKKDHPYTKGLPKGFGIEIDGILAEFNIPPCSSRKEYIQSIEFMKNWVRDFVKNKKSYLDICCESCMLVPEDQLQSKEANERGCDPDYNAYTEDVNPRVDGYPDNHRCAGRHNCLRV